MPLHDWSRVVAGTFHDFHYVWVAELRNRLNHGLLPEGFYAQAEQVTGASVPDVLTLHDASDESGTDAVGEFQPGSHMVAVVENPPKVWLTQHAEERLYAGKRNQIVIRHRTGDRIVALIDVVSPGNKQSIQELQRLLEKVDLALASGVHALLLDLHPPGTHDPRGIHVALWEYAFGPVTQLAEPPRATLASYRADPETIATAYVQPVSLGETLPDMPLFLHPDWYINLPIEETYQRAWNEFPDRWKRVVGGDD